MNDRELLELAAKAAGLSCLHHYSDDVTLLIPSDEEYEWDEWNPLEDDGDALRLAVKLRIDLRLDDPDAACAGWTRDQDVPWTLDGKGPWYRKEWVADNNFDHLKTARRAIVRAAAEIGRAMK